MTLEEAIEHCKEVATENRRCALEFARVNVYDAARNCQKCAAEHEQVAEWLAELKQRREAEITAQPKSNADRIRQMTDEELVREFSDSICNIVENCENDISCYDCKMQWLKQEVSEDDIQ